MCTIKPQIYLKIAVFPIYNKLIFLNIILPGLFQNPYYSHPDIYTSFL